jgi:hypothetical protein
VRDGVPKAWAHHHAGQVHHIRVRRGRGASVTLDA